MALYLARRHAFAVASSAHAGRRMFSNSLPSASLQLAHAPAANAPVSTPPTTSHRDVSLKHLPSSEALDPKGPASPPLPPLVPFANSEFQIAVEERDASRVLEWLLHTILMSARSPPDERWQAQFVSQQAPIDAAVRVLVLHRWRMEVKIGVGRSLNAAKLLDVPSFYRPQTRDNLRARLEAAGSSDPQASFAKWTLSAQRRRILVSIKTMYSLLASDPELKQFSVVDQVCKLLCDVAEKLGMLRTTECVSYLLFDAVMHASDERVIKFLQLCGTGRVRSADKILSSSDALRWVLGEVMRRQKWMLIRPLLDISSDVDRALANTVEQQRESAVVGIASSALVLQEHTAGSDIQSAVRVWRELIVPRITDAHAEVEVDAEERAARLRVPQCRDALALAVRVLVYVAARAAYATVQVYGASSAAARRVESASPTPMVVSQSPLSASSNVQPAARVLPKLNKSARRRVLRNIDTESDANWIGSVDVDAALQLVRPVLDDCERLGIVLPKDVADVVRAAVGEHATDAATKAERLRCERFAAFVGKMEHSVRAKSRQWLAVRSDVALLATPTTPTGGGNSSSIDDALAESTDALPPAELQRPQPFVSRAAAATTTSTVQTTSQTEKPRDADEKRTVTL